MIYYIDGNEVSQAKAKAYFFSGHAQTQEGIWHFNAVEGTEAPELKPASEYWNARSNEQVRDQIFNISAIQEDGGLEIAES